MTIVGTGAAAGLRFAIIRSRFNEDFTKRLLEGALDALHAGGADDTTIDVVLVPGAFEIPVVASRLARSRRYHAVICLGAVIRGETPHFDYISAEVSRGIARAAYDTGVPVIFGVLTTNSEEEAAARSGSPGTNRGYAAGAAAIEMATLMKQLTIQFGSARRGKARPAKKPARKKAR